MVLEKERPNRHVLLTPYLSCKFMLIVACFSVSLPFAFFPGGGPYVVQRGRLDEGLQEEDEEQDGQMQEAGEFAALWLVMAPKPVQEAIPACSTFICAGYVANGALRSSDGGTTPHGKRRL